MGKTYIHKAEGKFNKNELDEVPENLKAKWKRRKRGLQFAKRKNKYDEE